MATDLPTYLPTYLPTHVSIRHSDSGEVAADKDKVPMVFAEIRPDEIPDVPFQKFLFRGKQEEEGPACVQDK